VVAVKILAGRYRRCAPRAGSRTHCALCRQIRPPGRADHSTGRGLFAGPNRDIGQNFQVALKGFQRARADDLDHHLLPILQLGAIDLPNRGRGNRDGVERGKQFFRAGSPVLRSAPLPCRCKGRGGTSSSSLLNSSIYAGGSRSCARAEGLAHFDKGWAQFFQRLAQLGGLARRGMLKHPQQSLPVRLPRCFSSKPASRKPNPCRVRVVTIWRERASSGPRENHGIFGSGLGGWLLIKARIIRWSPGSRAAARSHFWAASG
jgi:hypothetical protein